MISQYRSILLELAPSDVYVLLRYSEALFKNQEGHDDVVANELRFSLHDYREILGSRSLLEVRNRVGHVALSIQSESVIGIRLPNVSSMCSLDGVDMMSILKLAFLQPFTEVY